MIIRILIRGYIAMMLVMLRKQFPIEIIGKQQGRYPACQVIQFFMGGDYSMHGVMSSDEKSRVQVCLDQNPCIDPRIGPAEFQRKQEYQGDGPYYYDRPPNQEAFWINGSGNGRDSGIHAGGGQKERILSFTCSMSHMGVEVAPQIPTESFAANHASSICSAFDTKKVLGFLSLQTL